MTEPYYQDELVTLYHGDCREITEWLAADVLVTDPPYGMSWEAGSMYPDYRQDSKERVIADDSPIARDDMLAAWGDRPAIVFGRWSVPRPPDTRHRLIWHKQRSYPGLRTSSWYPADEEIYILGTGWVGKPRQNVYVTDEMRSGSAGAVAKIGHPTPKPIRLMDDLIRRCPPGTIADPFAGSGSTLVAAKMLGRKAIGVEIEEKYCEIAAQRLLQDVLPFEVTA